ncbi:MAG: DegT/DnrJ/EryC1/StrS family aminotransferase [Terriglobia bacterium]|jgi:dTDP-4-amino-4,6-dideoxygalactose transaminase
MRNDILTRRKFLEKTSVGLAAVSVASKAGAVPGNPNVLAVKGGTPVRTKDFPTWPQTNELDEANILKSLRNHRWCTFDGEFIPQFEKAWAERLKVGGCVITPCGTHALHTALEILGIGPGDEVLVSPYTYIATLDAIMLCYALPVFVDSDLKTFQLDPEDIEHRITAHTRAILPVHIFGGAAHMDKVLAIAEKHHLPVIEDACQGHMAEWRGKKLGTLGTVGCFSFQESKNLPAGEAGALVSNREDLIAKAFAFRDFGRSPKPGGGYSIRGTKYRISDFAAAVLMAQLTRFDAVSALREANAAYLREGLKSVPGIALQESYPESARHNYYCFGLRYDRAQFSGASRETFIQALNAEGIPISAGYTPLNKEPFIEDNLNSRGFRAIYSPERLDKYRKQNHYPRNDELCATGMYLSQQVLIGSKRDVDDVVEGFAKVQKNAAML